MQFDSFSAFLQMGGHGSYIWAVYFIGIAVLLFNVVRPLLIQKQLIVQFKRARRREKRQETQVGQ